MMKEYETGVSKTALDDIENKFVREDVEVQIRSASAIACNTIDETYAGGVIDIVSQTQDKLEDIHRLLLGINRHFPGEADPFSGAYVPRVKALMVAVISSYSSLRIFLGCMTIFYADKQPTITERCEKTISAAGSTLFGAIDLTPCPLYDFVSRKKIKAKTRVFWVFNPFHFFQREQTEFCARLAALSTAPSADFKEALGRAHFYTTDETAIAEFKTLTKLWLGRFVINAARQVRDEAELRNAGPDRLARELSKSGEFVALVEDICTARTFVDYVHETLVSEAKNGLYVKAAA
jgi:hypothetical protein